MLNVSGKMLIIRPWSCMIYFGPISLFQPLICSTQPSNLHTMFPPPPPTHSRNPSSHLQRANILLTITEQQMIYATKILRLLTISTYNCHYQITLYLPCSWCSHFLLTPRIRPMFHSKRVKGDSYQKNLKKNWKNDSRHFNYHTHRHTHEQTNLLSFARAKLKRGNQNFVGTFWVEKDGWMLSIVALL